MEKELPKTYNPHETEKKWYPKWNSEGYFKPKKGRDGKKPYTIIMPPPNVTGKLHMGHALDNTIQDVIIRYKRMKGNETLWVPGCDHAGIATQSVVEKMIYQQQKKTRHDIGREDFVKKIWEWKEKYGGLIIKQLETIGVSCDWDYFTFTMDKVPNQAVRKVFTDLFNEGLIYQSDYIVNWCPPLESAISDAEVEHQEVKGAFYHINYRVKNSDELLEIATTRPETLFGDTAVAVNPNDERYKHLIGKIVILPLKNKEIPIIADDYVDIELGTGCLKVTPGHDFNDFEIGKRHNLPIVNILNKDGTLNDEAMEFSGQNCITGRKGTIKKLEKEGLLISTKDHIHQVGHCYRTGAVIEPMVTKQWFLNVEKMSADAVAAIETDKTKFYPKAWENTYYSWLRNPRNWCISRQLWWGHQIPVFYCGDCHHQWASEDSLKEILGSSGCIKCKSKKIRQDDDVLDTWFSSGLWPMSTLGWPNKEMMKERRFDDFYPTSTLVTAFDIIFFWVARMMMMGIKASGAVPFDKIYIHAMVRDKQGRKMSKSLGNGLDPIEIVNEYGADAMRFTLAAGSGYNRGLNLDPERITGYRNFVNKLWNAYRFMAPHMQNAKATLPKSLDHHDKWILSELNSVVKDVNNSIEEFRFDDASSRIYAFVYDKFCSWYIELSKKTLYSEDLEKKNARASVLKYTFKKIMALLHPITPFITEEIWEHIKEESEDLLIVQEYPEFDESLVFTEDQEQMKRFMDAVSMIRNLRASVNIKPKEEINIEIFSDTKKSCDYLKVNQRYFSELAKVKEIKVGLKNAPRPSKSITATSTYSEVYIPLEGIIDIDQQISKIENEIQKNSKEYNKLKGKLSNDKFMNNASENIVIETKAKYAAMDKKMNSLQESLKNFKG